MANSPVYIGTLTITSGQTSSNALSDILSAGQLKTLAGALIDMLIYAPATLTGTVTVNVRDAEGGNWKTLNIGGSDVGCTAGKATPVPMSSFSDLKLVSGSAEGSDRAFVLRGQVNI